MKAVGEKAKLKRIRGNNTLLNEKVVGRPSSLTVLSEELGKCPAECGGWVNIFTLPFLTATTCSALKPDIFHQKLILIFHLSILINFTMHSFEHINCQLLLINTEGRQKGRIK